MYANDLLDNKDLREELAGRIEVLDKVKKLVLLDGADFMTTEQVANYYEVDYSIINNVYQRFREELESDGMALLKRKSLKTHFESFIKSPVSIEEVRARMTITDSSGNSITIPNRGVYIFPKRAILRVGMLLRDSKVAVEVRNQLLNVVEHADKKMLTQDIDEEKALINKISEAFIKNDSTGILTASAELDAFRKRHIKKLTTENESLQNTNYVLADGILTWADRSSLNALIRKLAQKTDMNYSDLWNQLFKELKYQYHIDIKARDNGRKPYVSKIRDDEYPMVFKVFAAMCEKYGTTFDQIAKNCGFGIKKKAAFGKDKI